MATAGYTLLSLAYILYISRLYNHIAFLFYALSLRFGFGAVKSRKRGTLLSRSPWSKTDLP